MSWGNVKHPSNLVSVGQVLEVVILDIQREKRRITFGLKQRRPNPWESVTTKYAVSQRVKGKVTKLVPYGAFVELEPGVNGLIHVSELSWTKRIVKPDELLKLDQELEL